MVETIKVIYAVIVGTVVFIALLIVISSLTCPLGGCIGKHMCNFFTEMLRKTTEELYTSILIKTIIYGIIGGARAVACALPF
jgi:Fe2+ transport system protein B